MIRMYNEIIQRFRASRGSEKQELLQRVSNALLELNLARNNFNMVVGADNVELAILELNTAEKRYLNLLKEVKTKGITYKDRG